MKAGKGRGACPGEISGQRFLSWAHLVLGEGLTPFDEEGVLLANGRDEQCGLVLGSNPSNEAMLKLGGLGEHWLHLTQFGLRQFILSVG